MSDVAVGHYHKTKALQISNETARDIGVAGVAVRGWLPHPADRHAGLDHNWPSAALVGAIASGATLIWAYLSAATTDSGSR